MKILVGSKNPVKIEAVEEAFLKYFKKVEVIGIEVDSKVPNQPINEGTFEGAENRASELKRINKTKKLNAQFFIGLEGGIIELYSKWFNFGVVYIIDNEGKTGLGISPCFELPDRMVQELLNNAELGEITGKMTKDRNIKKKGGAIGFFSKGRMKRKDLYVSGLITALIPFINERLYFK